MPQVELTELEAKVAWLILDHAEPILDPQLAEAERSLFDKMYRAYRLMPGEHAA